MTRSPRSSDPDTLALICAIAQTRDARITGAALSNHYPAAGAQLQALGVLTRVGDEVAATSSADHEDTPVALARSPDGRSFGYFSPQAGWVTASPDDHAVYALSFETLLPKLLDGLDCPLVSRPVQLLPGLLWEVGGARLPGRSARVPVWIGRRLSDPATWALLLQQFQQRPSPGLRILLSLTAEAKLPKTYVSGHEIIAVQSVIDASDGFRIDPQILAARLAHGRDDGQPVSMAADGASITRPHAIVSAGFRHKPKETNMTVRHLNQIELAARWNISHRTLERWRWSGEGPRFIKIGGRVVYRLEDIEEFEAVQLCKSTADKPALKSA